MSVEQSFGNMRNFRGTVTTTVFALLLFVARNSSSVPLDGDDDSELTTEVSPQTENPESGPVNTTQPRLNAFQESSRKRVAINNAPESRVTITVGEDNGFHYTVNGRTYSRERIALSGEYFNDEYHAYGYSRLFLVAEPSIGYYAVRPSANLLEVYVQNYYYEEFYYEIYTPYPVSGHDLRHGQVNSTAILITGPSRSAIRSGQKG